ncbi:autotransporter outer membrane beta-barrel domain-containing protein [Bartonella sp. CB169]|uniref:autotransporter outer membrane beta-barrel domain-containing protein n=1 Tax=Bartonella sp. CB169 TaxID=3112257 RepID=UPI00300E1C01
MINVFRKHTFLCTLATAIASCWQISNVNASGTSCNSEAKFYKCSDGQKHILQKKTYNLTSSEDPYLDAAIDVRKKGTVIDASEIKVLGNDSDKITAYGAYVLEGGKLVLTNSNFQDVPGLRAQDAVITMTGGSIKGGSHAIYASGKKTDVALVRVNIDIEPDNLEIKGIGIVNDFGAFVRMAGVNVTFNEIGSFSTRLGGKYNLDNMTITGKGKKVKLGAENEDEGVLPEAFEVWQSGNVHLRDNTVKLTDMHGFIITNFSAFVNSRGKLLQEYGSSDALKDTRINVERSNISIGGEGLYGLYFDALNPDDSSRMLGLDDKEFSGAGGTILGKAFISLKNTTLTVPGGTVIYTTGDSGYGAKAIFELSEGTKISGDFLLKAENDSFIYVKANASSLIGDASVDNLSTAGLTLTRASTWYFTKSKYTDLSELDSGNVSLSFINLSDSTIVFKKSTSNDYKTLRIGKRADINEEGEAVPYRPAASRKVYKAEGNVQVKLNVFVDDEGLFDSEKTDRIFIYGDVHGNTLVHMENFLRASGKKVTEGKDQSVSLIQVSGNAKEDSFKLGNSYIAVNGFPYQYRLRGYGPGSTLGEASATNRLIEGDGKFWDFRLEGVYIKPEENPVETISGTLLPSSPETFDPINSSSTDFPSVPFIPPTSPTTYPSETTDSSSVNPIQTPSIPSTSDPSSPVSGVSPSRIFRPDSSTSSTSDPSSSESVDPPSGDSRPVLPTPSASVPSSSERGDPSSGDSRPASTTPSASVPSSSERGDPSSGDSRPASTTPSTSVPSSSGRGNPPSRGSRPASTTPSTSVPSSSERGDPPSESSGRPASPTPSASAPSSSEPVDPPSIPPVEPHVPLKQGIRALVPQLPTYLLLPNSLFHAGLMDLSTQSKRLETMRGAFRSSLNNDENSAFFLNAYGGSHRYNSNLSAFEYGYGAELDYNALEAGMLLKEIESSYSRAFFGIMGTYGSLFVHPRNVEQSKKSTFDKWSVSTYGNLQYNTDFYVDGVLSYGLFRGDVFTFARDKVVTLKGKQFSASMTSGKAFSLGHKSVVFDPQVQIIYQHLKFNRARDVDELDIDMGKFNQLTARVGGRLTRIFSTFEEGSVISLYGKLYLLHSFEDREFMSFKRDFQLGAFGSFVEAGLGFNARLFSKVSLHGDIAYQHRLAKAGFSGASFSAGLRYLF